MSIRQFSRSIQQTGSTKAIKVTQKCKTYKIIGQSGLARLPEKRGETVSVNVIYLRARDF